MSVFLQTNHLFLRNPRGGVEGVAEMAAAGFGAIFCNVDPDAYEPDEWQTVRDRARANGVACGPWLRTADAGHVFDPDRLLYLIDVADSWNWAPLICNSEKEIDHTGAALTQFIADEIGDRVAAISTEVRPFGAVDWTPLAKYPILPQNFPAETGIYDTDDAIRSNWYAAGARCVAITYGAYHGMRPIDFARLCPYGVYTGDDCGNDYAPWASLGTVEPCRDNGGSDELMTLIGNQHGITAMTEVWRETWPEKTKPNRKPEDLSTWGAIDKIERTLLILAEDHDTQEKGAA